MRFWLILIGLIALTNVLSAETTSEVGSPDGIHLSISSGASFSTGNTHEIVYRSVGSTDVMSLLVWPIPPSLGGWFKLDTLWFRTFQASQKVRLNFPLNTGTQTDDDWNISMGAQVHSESIAVLTADIESRTEFSYLLPFGFNVDLNVKPTLGFLYQHQSWQGWNAPQVVTNYNGTYTYNYYYNLVFNYDQTWYIPYIGLKTSATYAGFNLELGLNYSPYLFCFAYDLHVPNQKIFYDQDRWGWMLEPTIDLEYRLTSQFSIVAAAEVRWIQGLRGDTISAATTSSGTPLTVINSLATDQVGVSQFRMNFELGAKLTL